ncbi:MAG: histidine triad nucleotide-binding protein [Patescibacteria group bacterium]|jgi:histidine triad (HIT) family protein
MCVFCQIINKEIPSKLLFEDDEMVAFPDIKPSTAVHLLIVPKKHLASLAEVDDLDQELLGRLLYRAKELAAEQGIAEGGYKIVINTGKDGGQIVPHLHLHLLGGEPLKHPV